MSHEAPRFWLPGVYKMSQMFLHARIVGSPCVGGQKTGETIERKQEALILPNNSPPPSTEDIQLLAFTSAILVLSCDVLSCSSADSVVGRTGYLCGPFGTGVRIYIPKFE